MSAFLSKDFLSSMPAIAVALSGGPDSMALTYMLSETLKKNKLDTQLHALTVNHNLREDSLEEAKEVSQWTKQLHNTTHHILNWEAPKSDTRIMESARKARYNLLADYCNNHSIPYLYVAHHQDDQAETFLFRLSKGSGLDGLACMSEKTSFAQNLQIIRPLLNSSKMELIDYCKEHNLPFIEDPTNKKADYARPRLRESMPILEKEGLSAKRLSVTAMRIERAKRALQWMQEKAVQECCNISLSETEINLEKLESYPEDIRVRVLQHVILFYAENAEYAPRMEKIETIVEDLFAPTIFRKRTFASLIFEKKTRGDKVICLISPEK